MISPINFKADAGQVVINKPVDVEAQKAETVTAPVETAASFKGANALAVYNRAMLNTEGEAEEKALAFKGEEAAEEVKEAPAFKGAEETPEEKALAFKGEEAAEEVKEAPTFKGAEETPEEKSPAFKAEEQDAENEEKEAE